MKENNLACTHKYGLIGFPLSHSFSAKFFAEKFQREGIQNTVYQLFPIDNIDKIKTLLSEEAATLKGLNVTIPYKVEVIPYLHHISDEAKSIGAVNCIKILPNLECMGFNTDVFGFEASLKPLLKPHHQKALVFGNGGAAKAVMYALKSLGIDFQLVSRTEKSNTISYASLSEELLSTHNILINTTPLGMSPNINEAPQIPYEYVNEKHLAYDLVYNPEETLFLQRCAAQGAETKNGLEMLHLQAIKAWEIWNQ